MGNFFRDNPDLGFYVERAIDWAPLVELTEYKYRAPGGFENAEEAVEFYGDILDLIGNFVADEVAPHAAEIDRQGVDFKDGEAVFPPRLAGIFEAIKGLELHGMCLPRDLGGQNCPLLLYMLSTELFSRAEVSVGAHHGFHGGIAMALLVFSIREGSTEFDYDRARIQHTRFADAIEEIRRGEAWGCMDITEPDAGSDMAALRCKAEQDEAGGWVLTGQKIFITSGHGKYHFVIARTEPITAADAENPLAGLSGLSLFVVPAYEEDESGQRRRFVTVDRLEEKLGHHGSATCSLTFDRSPAYLVGERGEGFRQMLLLMNNARLGVGFEALGMCEAAYRLARDYAAERRSMGKTIDQHEMIADYLDEMLTDIQGIRALAVKGAYAEEMAQKLDLLLRFADDLTPLERKRAEQQQAHFKAESRRLTPLVKYLAAEKAVEMAQRCIQIHGGVGYTPEYGAEKLLRDAVVMPIYEGTSQIQALMAMKDAMTGTLKNPQGFVRRLAQARWRALSSRSGRERRLARLQVLSLGTQQHLITKTAADKFRALQGKPITSWPRHFFKDWDPKRDFAYAMLHAERLTRLLADEAALEILWEQAKAFPERRNVFDRYLERAEPRIRYLHERITGSGQRLLDALAERLSEGEEAAG